MFSCRPWRWIWGLIPLALLFAYVAYNPRVDVETDLTARSQDALGKAGLSWAVPVFDGRGRDAVLSGTAPTEADRKRAHQIVSKVRGVRIIEDRAELIPLAKPFKWSARHKGDKIRLRGAVPSEKARAAILGIAKANFPDLPIVDEMKLARGVPSREVWLGGVSYNLRLLAQMKKGSISLTDTTFNVSGVPKNYASYKVAQTALSDGVPSGLTKGGVSISLPVVTPYRWGGKLAEGKLTIDGFVPDQGVQVKLRGIVSDADLGLVLVDRTELAVGHAKRWADAILKIMPWFVRLHDGEISSWGNAIKIKGTAPDEATAKKIIEAFKKKLAGGISLKADIGFIPPPEPMLPKINPYWFDANSSNGVLRLTGFVPSEQAREAVLGLVKKKFPERRIDDQLKLGRGGPDFDIWAKYLEFGFAQLKGLKFGKLSLIGTRMTLSGEAGSGADYSNVFSSIKAAPSDLSLDFGDVTPPRVSPYNWSANFAEQKLVLIGHVPNQDARSQLMKIARSRFEGFEIVDQMTLGAGAPEQWQTIVVKGLQQLARLSEGRVSLSDGLVKFEGEVSRLAVAGEIADIMRYGAPSLYSFDFNISSGADITPKKTEPVKESNVEVTPKELEKEPLPDVADIPTEGDLQADQCQALFNSDLATGTIRFEVNKAAIRDVSKPLLDGLADTAMRCPGVRVVIAGHTDSDGDERYNLELSQRRAEAVVEYLTKIGVERSALEAVGYGEREPVAANDSEANKAKNRRIEFNVVR